MKNYYDILGVSKTATQEEIKQKYRELAKKWHPDANANTPESEEKFKMIGEAYATLSSPQDRARYDILMNGERETYSDSGFYRERREYKRPEWEFTYTTNRQRRDEPTSFSLGKLFKGVVQVVLGVVLIFLPGFFPILGFYSVFSGISNIRRGVADL